MTLEIPDLGAMGGHGTPENPSLYLQPQRDLSGSSSANQEATEGRIMRPGVTQLGDCRPCFSFPGLPAAPGGP